MTETSTAYVEFLDSDGNPIGNRVTVDNEIGDGVYVRPASNTSWQLGASEAHIGEVGGKGVKREVTLTLNSSIYASGDVLADTQEIANAVRVLGGSGFLDDLVILDKDDQAGDLDVLILRSNTSIGTENSPVSISDANAEEIIAAFPIVSSDYIDLVNSQLANLGNIGRRVVADSGSTSLYIAAISRSAKTYTSWGIVAKIGITQD